MTLLMRDQENFEKGLKEGNRRNAEKALARGLDLETIMEITGLTEEELEEIQNNMLVLQ